MVQILLCYAYVVNITSHMPWEKNLGEWEGCQCLTIHDYMYVVNIILWSVVHELVGCPWRNECHVRPILTWRTAS
jgi:hypothetical protein